MIGSSVQEVLCICINSDSFAAENTNFCNSVDSIVASSATTNNFDLCLLLRKNFFQLFVYRMISLVLTILFSLRSLFNDRLHHHVVISLEWENASLLYKFTASGKEILHQLA